MEPAASVGLVPVATAAHVHHQGHLQLDGGGHLVADHGGVFDRSVLEKKDSNKAGAAGQWRNSFMRAPYA